MNHALFHSLSSRFDLLVVRFLFKALVILIKRQWPNRSNINCGLKEIMNRRWLTQRTIPPHNRTIGQPASCLFAGFYIPSPTQTHRASLSETNPEIDISRIAPHVDEQPVCRYEAKPTHVRLAQQHEWPNEQPIWRIETTPTTNKR